MTILTLSTPEGLLFSGSDWNYEKLRRVYEAIEEVATGDLGLDTYPNQVEVITAEQMLDAYASIGMPLMYRHWSFGKHFAQNESRTRSSIARACAGWRMKS
jgi:stage V sporulation protein R